MSDKTIKLIPDKYVGNVELFGNWGWSDRLTGPMEHYPETLWCGSKKPANIKYLPNIEAVGMVRISAFMVGYSEKQDTNEEYEIHHADGVDTVYVDLSEYKTSESDWRVLGTYRFDGSGEEFVQLNHNTPDINTRASTLRFEIINDVKGDVWQYLYVGPTKKISSKRSEVVKLNSFIDLGDCKYQKEIEKAHYLGFVDADGEKFEPEEKISEKTFLYWLSKICNIDYTDGSDNAISFAVAVEKSIKEIKRLNINLEWLKNTNDALTVIKNAHILDKYPEIMGKNELTRADAAVFLFYFYHTFIASAVDRDKWSLSFQDDFDGDKLDENIWAYENKAPAHIQSTRWAKNVSVSNSVMHLHTIKEKIEGYPDKDWTTASVWVKPEHFSQYGGYWQASIKINSAKGINNAFWMIGNGSEIDIVEGHYPNSVHTNYHFEHIQYSENYSSPFDLSEDFHIYGLEWTEKELIYFFDGKEISRKQNIDAHTPLYPIFSTAVINWAGQIPDSANGSTMDVEWVRIYDKC